MSSNQAFLRACRAAHTKALRAPQTLVFMVADPTFDRLVTSNPDGSKQVEGDRATLERRACQYAHFIAVKDGLLPKAVKDCVAQFDGKATVLFHHDKRFFTVTIPDRIMAFDPDAPILESEDSAPLETLELQF
jgi:hypothetical protein